MNEEKLADWIEAQIAINQCDIKWKKNQRTINEIQQRMILRLNLMVVVLYVVALVGWFV